MKQRIKNFLDEFKAFALRGNMMDMAVGIIIGGAFTGIVNSLTTNFINPILNVVTGAQLYTLQDVAGFASSFVSALVNFLIMAFVLFVLLKAVNKVASIGQKKKEDEAPATLHLHARRHHCSNPTMSLSACHPFRMPGAFVISII